MQQYQPILSSFFIDSILAQSFLLEKLQRQTHFSSLSAGHSFIPCFLAYKVISEYVLMSLRIIAPTISLELGRAISDILLRVFSTSSSLAQKYTAEKAKFVALGGNASPFTLNFTVSGGLLSRLSGKLNPVSSKNSRLAPSSMLGSSSCLQAMHILQDRYLSSTQAH